jgi:hypothetical protein
MELSGTGDDILSGLLIVDTEDKRIRLSESLHTSNQLWKLSLILGLNSNSDDRRDRVFHGLDEMSIRMVSDGTGLDEVLIDSDKGTSVTTRNIRYELSLSSHHNNSSLDVLFETIFLLSENKVWSENSNSLTISNSSGKDSSESIESSLI